MPPPAIRIRVGASVDTTVDRAFAQVEVRANKAYQNTTRAASKSGKDRAKAAENAAAAEGKAAEKAASKVAQEAERAAAKAATSARKLQDAFANAWTQIGNVAAREMAKADRAAARNLDRFASRTSHNAARFLTPYAPLSSVAKRTANDLARGAGVNLDASSAISRNVDLESRAVSLSNQAYQAGQAGPNGQRQSAAGLAGEARSIGKEFAFDPAKVLEGLEKFTAKTGDLQTARDTLRDLTALSGATGSNLDDVVDAAGDVSNALGDVPDKGKRIVEVMKTIAGQGKLGAVEMRDLATQMAKVASAATQFEGDTGENIKKLGALVQFARATGGAASATQAATSIPRFADALTQGKTIKKFAQYGIHTTNDQGVARDPFAVILETLAKTNGDPTKVGALLSGSIGNRPVKALATTYRQAGGGTAGIEAVKAKFQEYTKGASLDDKTIQESNAARLQTTAAKAQQFQVAFDQVIQRVQEKLLPAMEKLEPVVLRLADVFGKLLTYAAENPVKAIVGAIVLAIGRAGIESALRAALETAIIDSAKSGGVGRSFSGAAASAGRAIEPGAGLVPAGGFLAPTVLGKNVGAFGMLAAGAAAAGGIALADDQNERLKKVSGGAGIGDFLSDAWDTGSFSGAFKRIDERQNAQAKGEASGASADPTISADVKRLLEQQTAQITALRSGVLRVEVTNPSQLARVNQ